VGGGDGDAPSGVEETRILIPRRSLWDSYMEDVGIAAFDPSARNHEYCRELFGDFLLYAFRAEADDAIDLRALHPLEAARHNRQVADLLSHKSLEELAVCEPPRESLDVLLQRVAYRDRLSAGALSRDVSAVRKHVGARLVQKWQSEWGGLARDLVPAEQDDAKYRNKPIRRIQQLVRRLIPDEELRVSVVRMATSSVVHLFHSIHKAAFRSLRAHLTRPERRAFIFFNLRWRSPASPFAFKDPLSFHPAVMAVLEEVDLRVRAAFCRAVFRQTDGQPPRRDVVGAVDLYCRKLLDLRLRAAPLVRKRDRERHRQSNWQVTTLGDLRRGDEGWRADDDRAVSPVDYANPEEALLSAEAEKANQERQQADPYELLADARSAVTPKQWEILELFYRDGMRVVDAAKHLGITHQSASDRLRRAKEKLARWRRGKR
jgi:DNA-directed RNA polymerase specialized sigma24 family protein